MRRRMMMKNSGGGDDPFNGHPYVVLPSGTIWALYNVGSVNGDAGVLYPYGTDAQGQYTGYTGNDDPMDISVDTARLIMGGKWRTPSAAQWRELTELSYSNGAFRFGNNNEQSLPFPEGIYWCGPVGMGESMGEYASFSDFYNEGYNLGVYYNNRSLAYGYVRGVIDLSE